MMDRIRRRLTQPSPYADVQIELTHLIFHKLLPTVLLGAAGVLAATFLLGVHYHDVNEWWLTVLFFVATGVRVSVVISFLRHREQTLTEAAAFRYQVIYSGSTMLYASAMSASTIYNFTHHDGPAITIAMIGTFSLCSGLGARLGPRPWVIQVSGLMMLVALTGCVLSSPVPMIKFGGLMMGFFAVSHWESVRHKFDTAVQDIRMKRLLRDLADHDDMTGLANRRHFEARLAAICERAQSFAILFIDLDKFKRVNDVYGHKTGDALLREVAGRLRGTVRSTDLVARLGGDEFAILHGPEASEESSEALAAHVVEAMALPFGIHGNQLRIGASVGIRLTQDDTDFERLLSDADGALYRVKQAGGGNLCFA